MKIYTISDWFLIFLILICTFGIVVDIISWKRSSRLSKTRLSKKSLNKFAKTSLKEYVSSSLEKTHVHLCPRSKKFQKIWKSHSPQIKGLGQEFLEETKLKATIGDLALFNCLLGEDSVAIRILFLEWLIKKTEQ